MKNNFFSGPIRDDSPCKDCPKQRHRPACRRECTKDAEWHDELERVKGNRRKYEQMLGVRSAQSGKRN